MSSKFSKTLAIIVAVLSLIGIALFINVSLIDKEDLEALNSAINPLIVFSTYLFYAAVLVAIVLSILAMVKNPENLKKTLISLAILGVVMVISYALGDSEAVLDANGAILEGGEEGASINQWVGSLIWYSVILVLVGGVLFVADLVKGLIKS